MKPELGVTIDKTMINYFIHGHSQPATHGLTVAHASFNYGTSTTATIVVILIVHP